MNWLSASCQVQIFLGNDESTRIEECFSLSEVQGKTIKSKAFEHTII